MWHSFEFFVWLVITQDEKENSQNPCTIGENFSYYAAKLLMLCEEGASDRRGVYKSGAAKEEKVNEKY